jgi:hypothetical protein
MIFVHKLAFAQKLNYFNKPTPISISAKPLQPSVFNCNIPGNFYYRHLGFMCIAEHAFEKKTKFPMKFRLGNIDYCNWLEGKNKVYNFK